MPNKYLRYAIAFLFIIGLILIRKYEDALFYDPLIRFFNRIGHSKLPEIDFGKMNASLLFRYLINSLFSILVIWFLFWNKKYIRFSIIIYIVVLIILIPIYNYMIKENFPSGEMIFFYIRRFLIQPMFLLILVPCFYYQEIQHKKTVEN